MHARALSDALFSLRTFFDRMAPGTAATMLGGLLLIAPAPAGASEIALVGSMGSRAVLVIDGGEPRTVVVGGVTPEGARLLSLDGDQAVVEMADKQHRLRLGGRAIQTDPRDPAAIVLHADTLGHFSSDALVNGARVRFLVDTGATLLALGHGDARRAGIDFKAGVPIVMQTAAGRVQVWRVRVDTLRIGTVTLHNVDAAVFEQDLPVALLGMSVLNRMEMQRQGNMLILHKRF